VLKIFVYYFELIVLNEVPKLKFLLRDIKCHLCLAWLGIDFHVIFVFSSLRSSDILVLKGVNNFHSIFLSLVNKNHVFPLKIIQLIMLN